MNVWCIYPSYLYFRFPMSIVVCFIFGSIWMYGLESPDPESIPYYGVGVLCFCLNTIITTLARPHFIIGQCHLFNRLRVSQLLLVFIIITCFQWLEHTLDRIDYHLIHVFQYFSNCFCCLEIAILILHVIWDTAGKIDFVLCKLFWFFMENKVILSKIINTCIYSTLLILFFISQRVLTFIHNFIE